MTTLNIIILVTAALIIWSLGWWWGFKYGIDSQTVVMLNLEEKMKALPPDVLAECEMSRERAKLLPPMKLGALRRGKSALEELHEDPTYRALMDAQKANGNGQQP